MEQHGDFLIVEPWNAASSLLMLIPALIWWLRLKNQHRGFEFIYYAIILIILGGLGSALFHGFRSSAFFLIMDVLPSALLSISMAVYFWLKILKKWWYIFFIMIPLFSIRFLFWGKLPEHTAINLSYFITGLTIGLPLILLLIRMRWAAFGSAAGAVLSFLLALTFRQLDTVPVAFLPMGTHFLWHAFSAVGAWFILAYLNRVKKFNPKHEYRTA